MSIPQKQSPPSRVGSADVGFGESRRGDHTAVPPTVETLLQRLEGVRAAGRGWTARCPAHEDRSASLSIAVGEDGRILVHDFAGCAVADVLAAIGLSVSDLFPQRLRDQSPEGRRALREAARQAQWRAALAVVAFEASVVAAAAHAVLRGPLNEADLHRLMAAAERVADARTILAPAETFRPRAAA